MGALSAPPLIAMPKPTLVSRSTTTFKFRLFVDVAETEINSSFVELTEGVGDFLSFDDFGLFFFGLEVHVPILEVQL